MKVRDAHATLNGSKEEFTMPSGGLEIVADDGRALFDIRLMEGGAIEIGVVGWCRHSEAMLADKLIITPRYSNSIIVSRPKED